MNVGDNVTIASNTTITIRCPVSGIPKATVTWQRDGSHVAEGDRYSIKDDKSLVIEGEWVEERAKYTCIVQSKFGMDETSSYVMIIGNLSFLLHLSSLIHNCASCKSKWVGLSTETRRKKCVNET